MNALSPPVNTPESAAEVYAALRAGSLHPVSITQGIEALRAAAPENTLSNRQLADLLAAAAVRHHLSVNFDQGHRPLAPLPLQFAPQNWG